MIRFYCPEPESTGVLPPDESAHCCRVLRFQEGDEINLVDGKGSVFTAKIAKANPRATTFHILTKISENKGWDKNLILAVAPTKNADRMEWLVEKAVEMGVDSIILLKCEHSERKVMRLDRLEKIMVSAMKQSLKAFLPELRGPIEISEFIESCKDKTGLKVMGYCSPEVKRVDFSNLCQGDSDVIVMIGPEGDFSSKEVKLAIESGFIPITLGKSRLRTETAAIYSVAAFHALQNFHSES